MKPSSPEAEMNPKSMSPVPPWDPRRTHMVINEVPAYLFHEIGVRYSVCSIRNWINKGVRDKGRPGYRVRLKTSRFGQRIIIAKADLLKFIHDPST